LKDDLALAVDLLTILQKSTFTPQLIKTFAERKYHQNLLVGILDRLLKPSPEFVKLAIGTEVNAEGDTIVSGKVTEKVIEQWKPILADAIQEWAKQRTLTTVLAQSPSQSETSSVHTLGSEGESDADKLRYGLRKRFWETLLSGQNRGRVELWIDRGADQNDENKRIFDRLQSHKKEIERVFGDELVWQRLDDKRGCRIAYVTMVGGYKSDESRWPDIQDAMIDAMLRFEKALDPHLAKLKAELASEGL
jgi:hypothetical protein